MFILASTHLIGIFLHSTPPFFLPHPLLYLLLYRQQSLSQLPRFLYFLSSPDFYSFLSQFPRLPKYFTLPELFHSSPDPQQCFQNSPDSFSVPQALSSTDSQLFFNSSQLSALSSPGSQFHRFSRVFSTAPSCRLSVPQALSSTQSVLSVPQTQLSSLSSPYTVVFSQFSRLSSLSSPDSVVISQFPRLS